VDLLGGAQLVEVGGAGQGGAASRDQGVEVGVGGSGHG
jgi:hypothetical protein